MPPRPRIPNLIDGQPVSLARVSSSDIQQGLAAEPKEVQEHPLVSDMRQLVRALFPVLGKNQGLLQKALTLKEGKLNAGILLFELSIRAAVPATKFWRHQKNVKNNEQLEALSTQEAFIQAVLTERDITANFLSNIDFTKNNNALNGLAELIVKQLQKQERKKFIAKITAEQGQEQTQKRLALDLAVLNLELVEAENELTSLVSEAQKIQEEPGLIDLFNGADPKAMIEEKRRVIVEIKQRIDKFKKEHQLFSVGELKETIKATEKKLQKRKYKSKPGDLTQGMIIDENFSSLVTEFQAQFSEFDRKEQESHNKKRNDLISDLRMISEVTRSERQETEQLQQKKKQLENNIKRKEQLIKKPLRQLAASQKSGNDQEIRKVKSEVKPLRESIEEMTLQLDRIQEKLDKPEENFTFYRILQLSEMAFKHKEVVLGLKKTNTISSLEGLNESKEKILADEDFKIFLTALGHIDKFKVLRCYQISRTLGKTINNKLGLNAGEDASGLLSYVLDSVSDSKPLLLLEKMLQLNSSLVEELHQQHMEQTVKAIKEAKKHDDSIALGVRENKKLPIAVIAKAILKDQALADLVRQVSATNPKGLQHFLQQPSIQKQFKKKFGWSDEGDLGELFNGIIHFVHQGHAADVVQNISALEDLDQLITKFFPNKEANPKKSQEKTTDNPSSAEHLPPELFKKQRIQILEKKKDTVNFFSQLLPLVSAIEKIPLQVIKESIRAQEKLKNLKPLLYFLDNPAYEAIIKLAITNFAHHVQDQVVDYQKLLGVKCDAIEDDIKTLLLAPPESDRPGQDSKKSNTKDKLKHKKDSSVESLRSMIHPAFAELLHNSDFSNNIQSMSYEVIGQLYRNDSKVKQSINKALKLDVAVDAEPVLKVIFAVGKYFLTDQSLLLDMLHPDKAKNAFIINVSRHLQGLKAPLISPNQLDEMCSALACYGADKAILRTHLERSAIQWGQLLNLSSVSRDLFSSQQKAQLAKISQDLPRVFSEPGNLKALLISSAALFFSQSQESTPSRFANIAQQVKHDLVGLMPTALLLERALMDRVDQKISGLGIITGNDFDASLLDLVSNALAATVKNGPDSLQQLAKLQSNSSSDSLIKTFIPVIVHTLFQEQNFVFSLTNFLKKVQVSDEAPKIVKKIVNGSHKYERSLTVVLNYLNRNPEKAQGLANLWLDDAKKSMLSKVLGSVWIVGRDCFSLGFSLAMERLPPQRAEVKLEGVADGNTEGHQVQAVTASAAKKGQLNVSSPRSRVTSNSLTGHYVQQFHDANHPIEKLEQTSRPSSKPHPSKH